MAGEINFGMLNTNAPAQAANSFYAGQEEQQRNQLAKIQQQMAQYSLGKAQREDASQNALSEAYRSAYDPTTGQVNQNALMQTISQRGQGHLIPGIQSQLLKTQKDQAEIGKTGAETSVKQLEAANKRADLAGQAFGYVRANPTPDNAIAAIDHLTQNGIYTPQQAVRKIL